MVNIKVGTKNIRSFLSLSMLKIWICLYSEWVLGNREDLVKDITAELQPENGEVMLYKSVVFSSSVIWFVLSNSSELMDIYFFLFNAVEQNILKQIVRSLVGYGFSIYWAKHVVYFLFLMIVAWAYLFAKRYSQSYHILFDHHKKKKSKPVHAHTHIVGAIANLLVKILKS